MAKSTLALYGNVALQRGYCSSCETYAIVRDGLLQCCGAPFDSKPKKFERMSLPEAARKRPSKNAQSEILRNQNNCCFYCGVRFGSIRIRNGNPVIIKINWDHQLPFAYSQNNNASNFVAACHVCNGIKSDLIFQTVEESQIYLRDKRSQKGYNF